MEVKGTTSMKSQQHKMQRVLFFDKENAKSAGKSLFGSFKTTYFKNMKEMPIFWSLIRSKIYFCESSLQ